jgi:hypothetical protein
MVKNIIANYICKILGIISVFIFVTFCIKQLSLKSYRVINLYCVIFIIIYFVDRVLLMDVQSLILNSAKKSTYRYINNKMFVLLICIIIYALNQIAITS